MTKALRAAARKLAAAGAAGCAASVQGLSAADLSVLGAIGTATRSLPSETYTCVHYVFEHAQRGCGFFLQFREAQESVLKLMLLGYLAPLVPGDARLTKNGRLLITEAAARLDEDGRSRELAYD